MSAEWDSPMTPEMRAHLLPQNNDAPPAGRNEVKLQKSKVQKKKERAPAPRRNSRSSSSPPRAKGQKQNSKLSYEEYYSWLGSRLRKSSKPVAFGPQQFEDPVFAILMGATPNTEGKDLVEGLLKVVDKLETTLTRLLALLPLMEEDLHPDGKAHPPVVFHFPDSSSPENH